MMILWEEYREINPDGYGYSRFCDLYGEWRRSVSATMRQTHVAGDKLFVDFAGDTVAVIDPLTGDTRVAHIFVAALGASNFTYAEGRWSEGLADWISVHVNTLAAIGGVPKAVVCDNLKAGVTKPSRYEPGINRTYADLATHYGFAVLPARIRKPRDKAKAEVAVQIVQRFVLARLRGLAEQLEPGLDTIFNLHCPPHGTSLDRAPQLTAELKVVLDGGEPRIVPVGSTAVRTLIEEVQPVLSLHGHIHESKAVAKIGKTTCVNPGSAYSEGVIDGAVVEVRGHKIRSCQLVTG